MSITKNAKLIRILSVITFIVGLVLIAVAKPIGFAIEFDKGENNDFYMRWLAYIFVTLGIATVLNSVLYFIFAKAATETVTFKSCGVAVLLSAVMAVVWNFGYAFTAGWGQYRNSTRYFTYYAVAGVIGAAILAFVIYIYARLRLKKPSMKGTVIELLIGLLWFPAFAAICVFAVSFFDVFP